MTGSSKTLPPCAWDKVSGLGVYLESSGRDFFFSLFKNLGKLSAHSEASVTVSEMGRKSPGAGILEECMFFSVEGPS